jgi:hypothetical protein
MRSLLLVPAVTLGGLGLQQECTFDDDDLSGLETREDLDFAAEITTATDLTNFKDPLVFGQKDAPVLTHALN